MIEASRYVVQYFVNSAWQTPLLLMTAWVVSRILGKLGSVAQHRAWAAALIAAAIAPLGAFKQGSASVHLLLGGGPVGLLADAHRAPGMVGLAPGSVRVTPAIYFTILFGYLAFLIFAGLRLGWGLHKARRLGRRSTAVAIPPVAAEIWGRCGGVFAIRGATLACSSEIAGPVTVGARNQLLLLTPGFLSESTGEDLAAALGHECAHLERRDFLLNLLYELISLPIAYHPAAWMMKSRIAETRELICDRMAAERIAGSRSYAHSLLRLAAAMHTGVTTNSAHAIGMFDANTLENRIMSLMASQPSISRRKRAILAASGIFLLGLSGIAAVALTANVEEQAKSVGAPIQNASQNFSQRVAATPAQIYHVGGAVLPPKLVYAPDPEYPKGEKRQGVVVISAVVDEKGQPQQIQVARSFAPAFDKSAMQAVEQYRFTPGTLQGKPVAVQVHIEVNFRRH